MKPQIIDGCTRNPSWNIKLAEEEMRRREAEAWYVQQRELRKQRHMHSGIVVAYILGIVIVTLLCK